MGSQTKLTSPYRAGVFRGKYVVFHDSYPISVNGLPMFEDGEYCEGMQVLTSYTDIHGSPYVATYKTLSAAEEKANSLNQILSMKEKAIKQEKGKFDPFRKISDFFKSVFH